MSTKDSDARLSVAAKAIEKQYGDVVKWLGDAAAFQREVISTGCLGLDNAIGNGGFERGLVAELFGRTGGGKSFLGYSVLKQACAMGYKGLIIDAEHSLDPKLLLKVGLPKDQVLVVDGAPTGEANLSIADNFMSTGEFAVVMVDSVAALLPEYRAEHDYDQGTVGLHARLMSAGLQKITPVAKKTNTLLIFINQIRNKVGQHGNPETTTGGEALPFYASYRVEVIGSPTAKSRRLTDEVTGQVYGHKTSFRVVKNKRSAPYREAEVDLIYGSGYDTLGELVDLGIDLGLMTKSGAWIYYGDLKWQGKDRVKLELDSNAPLQKELHDKVRRVISGEALEDVGVPNDQPSRKERKRNSD